jgi:hypothetical protein
MSQSTNKSHSVIRLDQAGRIRIPSELAPKWSADRPITLLPLAWKRDLSLPPERHSEAWLLCDLVEHGPDTDWIVSPHQIRDLAHDEIVAADLASAVFDLRIEKHRGAWRTTLPKPLRDLGWLPKAREKAILKAEPEGVSVWTETAYRLLFASFIQQWQDLEP